MEHRRLAHDRAERRVRRCGRLRRGIAQGRFLQSHLGTSKCTLAYWHEPYYNGAGIASSKYADFWQTLRAANADIVLNGHIHTYARFAPQDAGGNADAHGVRQFIVGTGGEDHGSLNGSTTFRRPPAATSACSS